MGALTQRVTELGQTGSGRYTALPASGAAAVGFSHPTPAVAGPAREQWSQVGPLQP